MSEQTHNKKRVLVAGATGYIGKHVVRELVRRGHEVVCITRSAAQPELEGARIVVGDVTKPASLASCLGEMTFDSAVSCLATRTGAPKDAWLVEHEANLNLLRASQSRGVTQFVLLSAICVQKPKLAFQHAKLAFEAELVSSGLTYSIVRPTAFFKSLSGQIERVKRGKPFLMFGDGTLTACKPIGEKDLARFIADCFEDPAKQNAILPIGGPDPAITPQAQAALLFDLFDVAPRVRSVPVGLLDVIISVLSVLGRVSSALADKAELARIGRYYATESMLVYDPLTGAYDAAATPSFGEETLRAFYSRVREHGLADQALGEHAVFGS